MYALGNISSLNKLHSGLYCSDIVISNSVDNYISILHPNDVKVDILLITLLDTSVLSDCSQQSKSKRFIISMSIRLADYSSIAANITVINNDFTSQFTTYMFAATYFRDQTQFYYELLPLARTGLLWE